MTARRSLPPPAGTATRSSAGIIPLRRQTLASMTLDALRDRILVTFLEERRGAPAQHPRGQAAL